MCIVESDESYMKEVCMRFLMLLLAIAGMAFSLLLGPPGAFTPIFTVGVMLVVGFVMVPQLMLAASWPTFKYTNMKNVTDDRQIGWLQRDFLMPRIRDSDRRRNFLFIDSSISAM